MKRKHWAALAFILAVIPVGVVGFNAFKVLQNPGYSQASAHPTVFYGEIPSSGAVQEIAQLTGRIDSLNDGLVHDKAKADLKLFGYEPQEDGDSYGTLGVTGEENAGDSLTGYTVSLAFSSQAKGFCVIDGKFYSQGAILPDGAKIVKVEAQRVLIHKFNLKRWIPVTESVGVVLSKMP
jgi:hypothetical protein